MAIAQATLAAMTPAQRADIIYRTARAELANSLWRAALGTPREPDPREAGPALSRGDMDSLLKLLTPESAAPGGPVAPETPRPPGKDATPPPIPALIPDAKRGAGGGALAETGLGPNVRYREALSAAAQRTGIPATALATIVDAEAAKDHEGRWNCLSRNPRSSAAGLGQFLNATWEGLAETPGTALNATARGRGWLDAGGRVLNEARGALLALRYDATAAIDGVADYARGNLAQLQQYGVKTDDSVTATARAAYLAHHLGLGDAVRFLKGGIIAERAELLLRAQVGADAAEKRIAQAGGATQAHQQWLLGYIDRRIQPRAFAI